MKIQEASLMQLARWDMIQPRSIAQIFMNARRGNNIVILNGIKKAPNLIVAWTELTEHRTERSVFRKKKKKKSRNRYMDVRGKLIPKTDTKKVSPDKTKRMD